MKCSRRPIRPRRRRNRHLPIPGHPGIVRDTDAASESTKRLFFRVAEEGRGEGGERSNLYVIRHCNRHAITYEIRERLSRETYTADF